MGFVLLVHEHLAPVVQRDGGVVRVTHGSTGKHAGVSAHLMPDQLFGGAVTADQFVILILGDALRVLTVDIDDLASGAVELLDVVGLAATTTGERLVAQDELRIDCQRCFDREEEPLALTTEGRVVTCVGLAGIQTLAGLRLTDRSRFERLLGLHHGGCCAWDSGDKPLPLVMTAQEAVLAALRFVFDEEEQVAVVLLLVQQGELRCREALLISADGEELPVTIVTDVERVADAEDRAVPAWSWFRHFDLKPCADGFERAFEMFEFHHGIIESSSVRSALAGTLDGCDSDLPNKDDASGKMRWLGGLVFHEVEWVGVKK